MKDRESLRLGLFSIRHHIRFRQATEQLNLDLSPNDNCHNNIKQNILFILFGGPLKTDFTEQFVSSTLPKLISTVHKTESYNISKKHIVTSFVGFTF